jgi:hypothetical protein
MARLTFIPGLTRGHVDMFEHQIQATHRGQAYFANTGPFGAICSECMFWGYHQQVRNSSGDTVKTVHRHGCKKFHELTGKHGDIVPASASACRYFERRTER